MMASGTIAKAFKGLIEKEWILKTHHLGGKYRFEVRYRLTGKFDGALSKSNIWSVIIQKMKRQLWIETPDASKFE